MPRKGLIGKDMARQNPEGFVRDIVRFPLYVDKALFIPGENSCLQEIDYEMLSLINGLPYCPLADTTKGVHSIRYLIQELLTANYFVLDPLFPTDYNRQIYEPKGQLLFPLKEVEGGKKSYLSLTSKDSTLVLKGVQYWQVCNATDPTVIAGYDALQIEVAINLYNASEEMLPACFESAECLFKFHGFCGRLDGIDF